VLRIIVAIIVFRVVGFTLRPVGLAPICLYRSLQSCFFKKKRRRTNQYLRIGCFYLHDNAAIDRDKKNPRKTYPLHRKVLRAIVGLLDVAFLFWVSKLCACVVREENGDGSYTIFRARNEPAQFANCATKRRATLSIHSVRRRKGTVNDKTWNSCNACGCCGFANEWPSESSLTA
jgi:hypothetical protein